MCIRDSLDIDTLQELENLLDSWPGTLVVISHDRYLIERIADVTYALFGDGDLTNLPGGIEQYLERRKAMASQVGVLDLGEAKPTREEAGKPKSAVSPQLWRELSKKMKSLDRTMDKLDEQITRLENEITAMSQDADPDFEAIGAKTGQVAELRAQRETLEMEWLELGEQLEG